MTVTRRLRFEVLRRDSQTCRYCGASAPEAKLSVDHVVPVALGGSDDPENLVTACVDCNAGKAATSPDEVIVADVAADALRWAAAIETAAQIRAERRTDVEAYAQAFDDHWGGWSWNENGEEYEFSRPPDWRGSVERFQGLGLDLEFLRHAIDTAMRNRPRSGAYAHFRYMCGIVYSELRSRAEMAREILEAEESRP